MKTLVIHPIDSSTDFLCPIYENINCDVIRDHPRGSINNETINKYDRIIMLGHGTPDGLLHTQDFGYLVDDDNISALQGKNLVGIWCDADEFFEKHNLTGLFTGMIISEKLEAMYCLPQFSITTKQIKDSNSLFAETIKLLVEKYCGETINESAHLSYRADVDRKYPAISPLMAFNNNRIYFKK